MAVLSRRQFSVTDQAGNIVAGASIEVRLELVGGQPLAVLWSDRAGTVALGNPFAADANGFAFFHAAAGVYRVRAYTGPSGAPTFEQIWDYVAVGTIDELDYSTDGTLAANSDALMPTQKAVKTYVDGIVAATDAMVFKGVIDCSGNPNYPAADRGWTYRVSVAGKIGGTSGVVVENGDILLCMTDGTASGTQAAVGAQWAVAQTNIDGAVVGPASSGNNNVVVFSGTTGKLIADSTRGAPSGSFVGTSDAQTLSNKALTAPAITGGTAVALTGLGIRSTGTGAFDLQIVNSENLSASRALTVTLGNSARTLSLGGNLTVAVGGDIAFTGGSSMTLTNTGTTSVTFPTSGTLATLAGAEVLTGKTIAGGSNTISGIANASLSNMAAFTLKGNATAGSAAPSDISIPALTQKVSLVAGDMMLIADSAASNALKFATVSAIASAGSVASIDAKTGSFTTGGGLSTTGGNVFLNKWDSAVLNATLADPAGSGTTTGVMMGLGANFKLTPAYSTRVKVKLEGVIRNNTAGNSSNYNLRFGTGTAPANGSAPSGTVVTNTIGVSHPGASQNIPFSVSAIITGLTPGVAYWFDVNLAPNANTSNIATLTCNAAEQ